MKQTKSASTTAGYLGGFALLTTALCVAASGIGGRALWCDEILRIMGQRMTVAQLLQFEHLRTFCTQTPAGYLFMRPWQKLLGMETGGFLLSALCGGLVTAAALWAATRLLGKRPHPLAALLVATNPLLVYYGSELAFYSLWAAAGAISFALLVEQCLERGASLVRTVALAVAGTAFVAFHFAGMFVWLGVAAAAGLATLLEGGARNGERTGRWTLLARRVPALLVPVVLNLPMYIGASRAPEHIGSKTLQLARLGTLWPELGRYAGELLPTLTGGWWFGIVLFLFGAWRLSRTGRSHRCALGVAAAMTFAIALFLAYSHLRDYMPRVSRYWVYAVAPMLTVAAAGLHGLLGGGETTLPPAGQTTNARRPTMRAIGWVLGVAVLLGNAVATGSLLVEEGRPHPYARLRRYLEALPAGRTVVSANIYENRFLGGYYPIPNDGQMLSPCQWEEGRDARVRGLQRIWKLVPDAVAYVTDADRAAEFTDAGVLKLDHGLQHVWPRMLRLAWDWNLYPEPAHQRPTAPGLFHETRESLAAAADATGRAVVVPESGWTLVPFRAPQGDVRFALLAANGSAPASLAVYVPRSSDAARDSRLDLGVASYRATRLDVAVGGQKVEGNSPQLAVAVARSQYLPQRQTFNTLPNPEHLLQAGMQFVVETQPSTVAIPLGALPPGWSTVTLVTAQKTPWLLLSHACGPAGAEAAP